MNQGIQRLNERFKSEKNNIMSYIEFMEENIGLPTISNLKSYCEELNNYVEFEHPIESEDGIITLSEAKNIYGNYLDKLNELEDRINFYNSELGKIEYSKYYDENGLNDVEESIVIYIYEHGYYDFFEGNVNSLDTYQELFSFFESELDAYQKALIDGEHKYLAEYNNLIKGKKEKAIIEYCIGRVYNSNKLEIQNIKDFFSDLDIRIRANTQNDTLNIYRQGFILLVATVDATIFDLTRILLDNCFFNYISSFCNKADKIKVIDFKRYTDFNEFKIYQIQKRLKGKYIKDILEIFKSFELEYVTDNYTKLIEIINRRNIHIHNQGIVDKRYKENINPYNLEEGSIASIAHEYFHETSNLLTNLIDELCRWIDDKIS